MSRPARSAAGAALRRLCPRCREGLFFASPMRMNDTCPVCGLAFGRGEPGYFTGAMYVSYALAIPVITALTGVGHLLLPRWSLLKLVLLAWVLCVPLIPWFWQYSRVVWVYFDRYFDPE